MATHPNSGIPEDESKDPVWDLIGKTPHPEVPGFFVAKVMGKIASLPSRRSRSWWGRLVGSPAGPTLAATAALLLLFVGLRQDPLRRMTDASPTPAAAFSIPATDIADLDVIADLDQLLASEETSTWLDTPAY